MLKIKVRISETKYRSFYKTLGAVNFNINLYQIFRNIQKCKLEKQNQNKFEVWNWLASWKLDIIQYVLKMLLLVSFFDYFGQGKIRLRDDYSVFR